MNINNLWRKACNYESLIKESVKIHTDLENRIRDNSNISSDMEAIEQKVFDKYDFHYAQDKYDIIDDLNQPGVVSTSIFDDDDKIQGWIYGYKFIHEDNWDDIDFDNIKWFDKVPVQEIEQAAQAGDIIYVSNFALNSFKAMSLKLLIKFIEQVKAAGYKYIAANFLSDSYKLFMNLDGTPKTDRLKRLGVSLVGVVTMEDDHGHAALIRF